MQMLHLTVLKKSEEISNSVLPIKNGRYLSLQGKEFVYEMTRLTGYRCVPWGRLIKKEFFKGFSFPVGRRMEDLYAMPGLMVKLNSIIYTNEPLYMYRYRAASDIHSPFKISRTDELDGYINLTSDYSLVKAPMLTE